MIIFLHPIVVMLASDIVDSFGSVQSFSNHFI